MTHTPSELSRQRAHYKAVRARLGFAEPCAPLVSKPAVEPSQPRPTQVVNQRVVANSAGGFPRADLPAEARFPSVVIARATCAALGITRLDLESNRRVHRIVVARRICMYLMSRYTRRTYREIGNFLGGFDHSTVIVSVARVEKSKNDRASDYYQALALVEAELMRGD